MRDQKLIAVVAEDATRYTTYLNALESSNTTALHTSIAAFKASSDAARADLLIYFGEVATTGLLDELCGSLANGSGPLLHVGPPGAALVTAAQRGNDFLHVDDNIEMDEFSSLVERLLVPRGSVRFEATAYTVHGTAGEASFDCPLIDISNHGLAFYLPSWADIRCFLPGKKIERLAVLRGNSALLESRDVIVRQIQPCDELPQNTAKNTPAPSASDSSQLSGYRVGVEFLSRRHDENASAKIVTDPVRIAGLLTDAFQHRSVIMMALDSGDQSHTTLADTDISTVRPLVLLAVAGLNLERGSPLRLTFEADGARYQCFSSVTEVSESASEPPAKRVAVRMPRRLQRVRYRDSGRVRPQREAPVRVSLISPFTNQKIEEQAIDISLQGVSIFVGSNQYLLPAGTRIDELTLQFDNGATLQTAGKVRYVSPTTERAAATGAKCGIEFDALSVEQQVVLLDALFNGGVLASEEGVRDATGYTFDEVWSFLRSTGFIYPEKEAKLQPAMDEVRNTFDALLHKPNNVSKTLIFKRDSGVMAHVSALQIYSRTWLVHHLGAAKRQSGDPRVTRMMLLAIAQYCDQFPDMDWVNINYRPSNKWPRLAFGVFASRAESQWSKLRTYSYMTAPTTSAFGPASSATISVGQATAADMRNIEAHLLSTRGPLEFESRDFSKHLLTLDELNRSYKQLGLHRDRTVFVARDRAGIIGYALVEKSSTGLNLSELLSVFRIHLMREAPAARAELCQAIKEEYARFGKAQAVTLVPQEDVPTYEAVGFTKTKEYCSWTFHRSLFRKFYEHVDRETSLLVHKSGGEVSNG